MNDPATAGDPDGTSTRPTGDADDPELEALVAEALDRDAAGQPVNVEALCGDRPHLAPTLQRLLLLAAGLPQTRTQAVDPLLGRQLGDRYELTTRLGAGGMGMVYAAHDRQLDREVAVKVLDELFALDAQRVERFRREATSLAALDHPHIVAVHDFELASHPPFLVMDRVVGFDLAALVHGLRAQVGATHTPTPEQVRAAAVACSGVAPSALDEVFARPWPELVARFGRQMAGALAAAHAVGVVHRDVKPSNFMADATGRVRLLDFGLVRRPRDASLTRSDTRLGTPLYMAPEQVRGDEATAASDVYGLGAALYELCCLRPPFLGEGRELEARILHDEPTPPQRLCPRLPRDLAAIVLHALHKAPARRYGTAAALADDLDRFLRFEPVTAQTHVLPAPLRASLGWFRRYRRPALWGTLAAAVVGVVALALGQSHATRGQAAIAATQAEVRRLTSALSPYLGFAGSRDDRLQDPQRAPQLAVLDRILELAPDHDVARFLRLWVRGEEAPPPPTVALDRQRLTAHLGAARLQRLYERVALPVQQRDRADRAAGRQAMLAALAQLDDEPVPPDTLGRRLRLTVTLQLAEFDPDRRQANADAILELARRDEAAQGRSAFSCFARGVALQLTANLREARDALLGCAELCPNQPATLHNLARVHRLLGQPTRARTFMEAALAHMPVPHVNYLEQYATVLIALHDFAAADAVLARFPADPDSRVRAEIQRLRMGLVRAALAKEDAAGPAAAAKTEGLAAARAAMAELESPALAAHLSRRLAAHVQRERDNLAALAAETSAAAASAYCDLLRDPLSGRIEDPLDRSRLALLATALQETGDPAGDVLAAIAVALERLERDGVGLR